MSTSDGPPPVDDEQLCAFPKWDLPAVAEDHLAWVPDTVDLFLGPYSAYSVEERALLVPGCQLFVDVAQDTLADVLACHADLREQVTIDLSALDDSAPPPRWGYSLAVSALVGPT